MMQQMPSEPRHVAIIGAGGVGLALAARCAGAGLTVHLGVRDPGRAPGGAHAATSIADAVRAADVTLLCVPAGAAVDALRAAGDLAGRVVVDCTNPLGWRDGPLWTPPVEGSATAQLAAAFPEARLVKGFDHFGLELMRDPALAGGPADALFAGDDADAKRTAMALAARLGFRAHDAGPLRNAAALENLAVLWIQLATAGGLGREFSFRICGRE